MISESDLTQRGALYRRLATSTIGDLFPGSRSVVKLNSSDSVKKAMQVRNRCTVPPFLVLVSAREREREHEIGEIPNFELIFHNSTPIFLPDRVEEWLEKMLLIAAIQL